jgi:predicted RNA binding protein YcfA (HicA-like mRNA interferase family)
MSKLPAIRARNVARVAQSLGFVLDCQRGSHAVYYRGDDKKRVVIPMHGGKTLSRARFGESSQTSVSHLMNS